MDLGVWLQADEIQLDLPVSVLARPDVERSTRHLVHERNGKAELAEIDALQILAAALAGIDAEMLEIRRVKVHELPFILLPTTGTEHAPEGPCAEARGAQKMTAAAFQRGAAARSRLQHRELWCTPAGRTVVAAPDGRTV